MKIFRKILRYWIAHCQRAQFPGRMGHSGPLPQAGPAAVDSIGPTDQPCPACLPSRLTAATTSNGLTFFSTTAPTNPPANNIQPIQPVQPSQSHALVEDTRFLIMETVRFRAMNTDILLAAEGQADQLQAGFEQASSSSRPVRAVSPASRKTVNCLHSTGRPGSGSRPPRSYSRWLHWPGGFST